MKLLGKLDLGTHVTGKESLFQHCRIFSFCGSVGSLCRSPPCPFHEHGAAGTHIHTLKVALRLNVKPMFICSSLYISS